MPSVRHIDATSARVGPLGVTALMDALVDSQVVRIQV